LTWSDFCERGFFGQPIFRCSKRSDQNFKHIEFCVEQKQNEGSSVESKWNWDSITARCWNFCRQHGGREILGENFPSVVLRLWYRGRYNVLISEFFAQKHEKNEGHFSKKKMYRFGNPNYLYIWCWPRGVGVGVRLWPLHLSKIAKKNQRFFFRIFFSKK